MKTVTKAIIPVAGKGTRFLPATKSVAKEMFPIVDIPALLLVLEECVYSGIKEVFIVLNKEKENIRNFLKRDPQTEKTLKEAGKLQLLDRLNFVIENLSFEFGYQDPKYYGSAIAVLPAKDWANNQPFAVLYPDDLNYTEKGKTPAIGQLIKAYEKYQGMIIGCKEIDSNEIYKYSACKIVKKEEDNVYRINGIVEKPKTGEEPSCISGLARYIMPENTFKYIEKQISDYFKGEIGLTDTMAMICQDSPSYAIIMDSIRYDTGDKYGYVTAVVEYALRNESFGEEFKQYLKNLVKSLD